MRGEAVPGPERRNTDRIDDRWEQDASFSVFFERRISPDGHEERRTRVYHDECDESLTVDAMDTTDWSAWIDERSRRPSSERPDGNATQMHVVISDVRLVAGNDGRVGEDEIELEVRVRIRNASEAQRWLGQAIITAALAALETM